MLFHDANFLFKAKVFCMKHVVALALLLSLASPATAAPHPCTSDAIARGKELLRLHFEIDELDANPPKARVPFDQLPNWSIDDTVKQLASIKALKGKGKLDVVELNGYIYKATYRMRFIYAKGEGCTLMGQEILEVADPY
jgi:hypothetical protein